MATLADLERTWLSARYLEQYPTGNPQFLSNDDMWYLWLQKVAPSAVGTRIDMQKAFAVANGGSAGSFQDSWLSYMKAKIGGSPVGTINDIYAKFLGTSWVTIPGDVVNDVPGAGAIANWTATRANIAYDSSRFFNSPGCVTASVNSLANNPWVNLSTASRIAKLGASNATVSFMVYPLQDLRNFRVAVITYDSGGALYSTVVGSFSALPITTWTLVTGTLSISDPNIVNIAAKIELSNSAPTLVSDVFSFDHMVVHFS